MHALLFRKWSSRVKGSDWYDLEWYIKKGVALHLDHFRMKARGSGDWQQPTLSEAKFRELLNDKIDAVSFHSIREDIIRFIPDEGLLDIWSPTYFKDLVKRLKNQ